MLAPIALFAYRRPDHTRRTLESLLACRELASSALHIYCDGPKTADALADIRETRRIARALAPASTTFVEHETNRGLARSIIAGTTELTERYGKVIVVEDDLEVAPSFLRFLNDGLARYADDERVMQVSGYQFPLTPPLERRSLFLPWPNSWGWGTWARAWRHFDPDATGYAALEADPALRDTFDLDGSYPYFEMLERQRRGEVDSWAIRWYLSIFMRQGLTLFPGRSLVRNTGFDGSGTHGASTGYSDGGVGSIDRGDWELPEVTLDVDARRRIVSFLAEQTGTDRRKRLKNFAVRGIKAVLSNPRVPASLRAAGTRVLARVEDPTGGAQDLGVYWDPKMAALLETWGIGNAWNEIQLLLINASGSVLDIACGTGKVMTLLEPYKQLEVHGFDISDFLIQKAIDRGIPRDRLKIADATKTGYADKQFDYGYSIGSLEHFTEDGVLGFVAETRRIIRRASFHQIPTSRSGKNHGWIKMQQSYHNNSVAWWLERFHSAFKTVHVFDSAWNDKISVGKWFVCVEDS